MISRWADSQGSPAAVVDVGAGVGIFTTAAARRWPAAQVWSVDVNPITLGLLALRVHRSFPLRGSDENGPGLRLVLDDFAAWMEHAWTGLPGGKAHPWQPTVYPTSTAPEGASRSPLEGRCGSVRT